MATRNNRNSRNNTTNATPRVTDANGFVTWVKNNALTLIVSTVQLLVVVIGFIAAIPYQINGLRTDMDAQYEVIETKIASTNDKLDIQTKNLEKSMELNTDAISACNTRIDNYIFNNKSDEGIKVSFTEAVAEKFFGSEYEVHSLSFISNPTWKSSDFIAVDNDGNEYTAEELVNEKILVSYVDDNQETCFWGQYNEKNQWDGNCVINVYKDDMLELIMDATYKNGVLMNYEQILADHTKERWIVSKRVSNGDINTGETWTYIKENDYTKLYDMNIVVSDDVMSAEYFRNHITTPLEGYYAGETSDGLYNDTTGNAYLVKYFENGLTKTIYKGNFVDGQFNDETGKAWYIVKEEDTEYMYYKGIFHNGSPEIKTGEFKNSITLEFIGNILEKEGIDLTKVMFPGNI